VILPEITAHYFAKRIKKQKEWKMIKKEMKYELTKGE
jgi:hypothetical protein